MSIAHRFLVTSNSLIPLPLRIAAGLVFAGHGAQKLFGMYGGGGIDGTAAWFASQGLEPGKLLAILAGGAEFIGGLLLLVGLFTRFASIALIGVMAVAIVQVHSGAFFLPAGMEFALTLLLVNVSLLISGAGGLSLDRIFFGKSN